MRRAGFPKGSSSGGPARKRWLAVGAVVAALVATGLFTLFLLPRLGSAPTPPPSHSAGAVTTPSGPATTSLCTRWATATVSGGSYIVENDEWGSSVPECVSTDGNTDMRVTSSSLDNTGGTPGGFPSIYMGCQYGLCTPHQNGLPRQVSTFSSGSSTNPLTSVTTVLPVGSSVYDVIYDVWFNHSSFTSTQPNAEELMVWLNQNGIQPYGRDLGAVTIDGIGYEVLEVRRNNGGIGWNTVVYEMRKPAASVKDLNLGDLALDSVRRGFMAPSDWLIQVAMGFEVWVGGEGLAISSYTVSPYGTGAAARSPA